MKVGVKRLLRMGLVPARMWEATHGGAATGNKESFSSSPFTEVNDLEVDEEFIHHGHALRAAGVWINKWRKELPKGWR